MRKNRLKFIVFTLFVLVLIIFISLNSNKKDNLNDQDKTYLKTYLSNEEIAYVINNNINIEDLKPYLKYENFNIFLYDSYKRIKEDYNLTYLESINFYNNPHYYKFYQNPKPALFIDTPLTLVNKSYYLDKDFIPSNLKSINDYDIPHFNGNILLKKEVLDNLLIMYKDALENGLNMVVYSGYRDYQKQEYLYNVVYNKDDTISAKPGYSEHQTGYAVDISTVKEGLNVKFEKTPTYSWLKDNCYRYGFILRYPRDKSDITGYQFEPWHFRYVGIYAEKIHSKNLTLEEYIFSNLEI